MIRIGLIGYGYWGEILARNLGATPDVCLAAIADEAPSRLAAAARAHSGATRYHSGSHLLANPELDAVVIATPLNTHYSLCKTAIEGGRHVLVEKPMAASVSEAIELVELARRRHVRLAVDHTFVYSGEIRKIRSIIDEGGIGEPMYLDSVRANFGVFRGDANVIWDLAAHDFAILDYLFRARPTAVSATAVRFAGHLQESLAHVNVHFGGGCLAHFHLNWLSPEKVRHMVICGNRGMIVYDDLRSTDKVRVYDKSVSVGPALVGPLNQTAVYRSGELYVPVIESCEPLGLLMRDFAAAILEGREPMTSGEQGVRVVALLAAAERSVRSGEQRICLGVQ